jgi:DHA2 family multidrug resistance protein
LTSYIVASAIMMPLTGWLAGHFGVKYIFLGSVVGFTIASALCGAATSLTQLVLYRLLQGVCSAGLVPLGQATLFTIYPRERHGYAMAIFSTGAMMGPIIGPTLGGWLTDNFGWRWCFYINLPVGALCALGIFVFIRQTRTMRRDAFDGFGFAMLSLGVGSLQLMLDRGQLKDWFHSTEIWIEATVAGLCFYLLAVHTMTAGERSFLNRELLKSPNFVAVQPDRPLGDRRPQSRSHPPSRNDRLQRRFRPDADRHPRLIAVIAAGPHPAPPANSRGSGRFSIASY